MELTGPLSSLGLIPTLFTFWFEGHGGLTSFALPEEINLQKFEGFNRISIGYSSTVEDPNHTVHTVLRGVIDTVSPIPEPETYATLLVGLGLVGFMARRRKQIF